MRPSRETLTTYGALLVAGTLYGLSFPPLAMWPLAWLSLAPALVVFARSTPRQACVRGAVVALVGAVFTVYWLPLAAVRYYDQSIAVGGALFIGITLVMVVPYVSFWAWFHTTTRRVNTIGLALLSAAAFTASEFWRSHILTGNPWSILGYTQPADSTIAQIADVTGVYGVSFVLLVFNVAVAELWLAWRREAAAAASIGFAAVLVAGCWLYSARVGELPAPTRRVGIVQGNLDLGTQWRRELYGQNLKAYLRATQDLLFRDGEPSADRPQLVVWPETAMTFFIDQEPLYRTSIASVIGPADVQLLAGGPRVDDGSRFFNSAFVVSPIGDVLQTYDKQKLLPLAEYFPANLNLLRRSFGQVREFAVGTNEAPLETRIGRAGILVCNEAMFPEIARRRVLSGSEILVNLSNDTWVGDAGYSLMAFDMARYRAVENRRYLVRASTSGPSGIVDPRGRVTLRTDLFATVAVAGEIAPSSRMTAYNRYGDVFAWICTVACVLSVFRRILA